MLKRLAKRFRKSDGGNYSEAKLLERWSDIRLICDFRSGDTVLDVGSAEGLISLQVAPLVSHVHGVELREKWVKRSRNEAVTRGIGNVTFERGSALTFEPETAYDIVLLLGVLGKSDDAGKMVDADALSRLCIYAKRQIIIRHGVQSARETTIPLEFLLSTLEASGFDAICFPRARLSGSIIVGNRKGTDAMIRHAPPFMLVPATQEHPCLTDTKIAVRDEFAS